MLHALIMAGGSGTRFWPRSRRHAPKQLHAIGTSKPLLVETRERLRDLIPPERIHIITNAEYSEEVCRVLPDLPPQNVLGEPIGRDTAAAIGVAAARVGKVDSDASMLVLPADHVIQPKAEFDRAVRVADQVLKEEPMSLITFGIPPTYPATGYGYIKRGAEKGRIEDVGYFDVDSFKEKPDLRTAEHFIDTGGYYWNAGIFAWTVKAILEEIHGHLPELGEAIDAMKGSLLGDNEHDALEKHYPELPKISIDFGVMERARHRSVIEAPFDWDDVGSWRSLERHHDADPRGNVCLGDVIVADGSGNIVDARGGLVALLGVDDLVVVRSDDAVLVCPKERSEEVKTIIQKLKRGGYDSVL